MDFDKIIRKGCIGCEHADHITDGFVMCGKDAIEVMVIADYVPTKNHLHCLRDNLKEKISHGDMAYQKESKTAYQMQHDGWCDDCSQDINMCLKQGECEGYKKYHENSN